MDQAAIDRMKQRIADLKQDQAAGEEQLRALEARQRDLQSTLLRIAGAIQVLEEVVQEATAGAPVTD
jgi:peptidoglycan hydrolase CwlO-like protein